MNRVRFLKDGPEKPEILFLFAHGAGAPMNSTFMSDVASRIAEAGIGVWRFEFPYMAERRKGRKRGPDRPDVLLESWRSAVDQAEGPSPYIGGKSLGGRIASMIAAEAAVRGIICFGYPFHPPGRPERLRTAHLKTLSVPGLILQGERDPFGRPDEVSGYELSPAIRVEWIPDGDHSFKPRKRSGHTLDDNLDLAATLAIDFMK